MTALISYPDLTRYEQTYLCEIVQLVYILDMGPSAVFFDVDNAAAIGAEDYLRTDQSVNQLAMNLHPYVHLHRS